MYFRETDANPTTTTHMAEDSFWDSDKWFIENIEVEDAVLAIEWGKR